MPQTEHQTTAIRVNRETGLEWIATLDHNSTARRVIEFEASANAPTELENTILLVSSADIVAIEDGNEADRINFKTRAVQDNFLFDEKAEWVLDVLSNDVVADDATELRIVDVAAFDGFETTVSEDGQTISVVPSEEYTCSDERQYGVALTSACWTDEGEVHFVHYTIEDNLGAQSDSAAWIRLPIAPSPVDDMEFVQAGEPKNLYVLRNDGASIEDIASVDTTNTLGTVDLFQVNGEDYVRYTPPNGTLGNDSFRYMVASDDGSTENWATVHITIRDGITVEDRNLGYVARVIDADGNSIDTGQIGEAFFVELSVLDHSPERSGVFSAFVDLEFESSLQVSGPIDHGATHVNATSGEIDSENGWIRNLGGVGGLTPTAGNRAIFATIPFVATSTGPYFFTLHAPDPSLDHPTLVYGIDESIPESQLTFESLSFRVETDPADVNMDGFIGPLDALILINELNRRTEQNEPARIETSVPTADPFDVNGDGTLSPHDPLWVINRLLSTSGNRAPLSSSAIPVHDTAENRARKISKLRRLSLHDAILANDETLDFLT